jgi:hypothetical protein
LIEILDLPSGYIVSSSSTMALTSTSKLISTLLLLASFTSKAAGQTCSLCPADGSSIEDDTRIITGADTTTCGEIEESVSFSNPSQCDEFLVVANADVGLTAFCCSNVDPLCSLCEEGSSLINPDTEIGDGLTCSDILTLSRLVLDATTCEAYSAVRPFCCSGGAGACQLCPNGGEIAFPDKAVPFLEDFGASTCAEALQVISFVPESECDNIESVLSFSAWCGCTDVTPPGICDLCGEGDLIDPDRVVPEFDGGTCRELDELTRYLTSEEMCTDIVEARAFCCTNPDPTSCTICPDESPVGLPDRKISTEDFDEYSFTCGELDRVASFFPEDDCDINEVESFNVNFASWCGCAGVETPDECFLCGPDEEISDPDAIIPESDGLTCEEGAELARHITNETFCENSIKPNVGLCCRPKPPTTAPTAAPTTAPTAESSAPASKFVLVALTSSGMLMVGTMIMMVG